MQDQHTHLIIVIHKPRPVQQLHGSLKAEHWLPLQHGLVVWQCISLFDPGLMTLFCPCELLKPHLHMHVQPYSSTETSSQHTI